jgi:hypothetical protein
MLSRDSEVQIVLPHHGGRLDDIHPQLAFRRQALQLPSGAKQKNNHAQTKTAAAPMISGLPCYEAKSRSWRGRNAT